MQTVTTKLSHRKTPPMCASKRQMEKMIFIYKGRWTKTWRSYKTASFIRKEEWVYTKIFILAEGRTVWRETASLNDTDGLIVLQQSVQKQVLLSMCGSVRLWLVIFNWSVGNYCIRFRVFCVTSVRVQSYNNVKK